MMQYFSLFHMAALYVDLVSSVTKDPIRGHMRHSCLFLISYNTSRGCSRGVIVKAVDCGIVVREFVLQSRYYVHFRANTLGKGMNPLILPAMG